MEAIKLKFEYKWLWSIWAPLVSPVYMAPEGGLLWNNMKYWIFKVASTVKFSENVFQNICNLKPNIWYTKYLIFIECSKRLKSSISKYNYSFGALYNDRVIWVNLMNDKYVKHWNPDLPVSQRKPVNDSGQSHLKFSGGTGIHSPPFKQGLLSHFSERTQWKFKLNINQTHSYLVRLFWLNCYLWHTPVVSDPSH